MKLSPEIEQGTEEWRKKRAEYFTASTLGDWLIEEPKLALTKAEVKALLIERKITPPADKAPLEEFVKALPNEDYLANLAYTARRNEAWENAIDTRLGKLSEEEEPEWDTWATKRGKALEPLALAEYTRVTGLSTVKVGFCAHDSDDFGASPDALALTLPMDIVPVEMTTEEALRTFTNGVELKCHIPRTHIRFLRRKAHNERLKAAGIDTLLDGFREEHAMQVHASMAATGLREWHLFGYCPDLPYMHEVFTWDETTDKVLAGLLRLSEDYWTAFAELKAMHQTQFGRDAA